MDKILSILGIYDLLAVLLSGIIIVFITIELMNMLNINILTVDTNETFSFILISYFVGTIFQELGSIIYRELLFINDELLLSVYESNENNNELFNNNKNTSLTIDEKENLFSYFKDTFPNRYIKNKPVIIYNYCKFDLLKNGGIDNTIKDQSISAMSRSLSIYFFIISVLFIFDALITINIKSLGYSIIPIFLTILFHKRSIRFTKLRYLSILRTFYYKYVLINTSHTDINVHKTK